MAEYAAKNSHRKLEDESSLPPIKPIAKRQSVEFQNDKLVVASLVVDSKCKLLKLKKFNFEVDKTEFFTGHNMRILHE